MSLLWCPNNFFFSIFRHSVWWIKSRTHLLINLSTIVRFFKWLRWCVPDGVRDWHALSHEQYFLECRFLGACRCPFNYRINILTAVPKSPFKLSNGFSFSDCVDVNLAWPNNYLILIHLWWRETITQVKKSQNIWLIGGSKVPVNEVFNLRESDSSMATHMVFHLLQN